MNSRPVGNGTLAPRIPREVAALMDALQLQGATTGALPELTDSEWNALLTFSDIAHLTLSLAQVERTGFPSWVVQRLEQNLADNAARFERVKTTYKEAAAAFEQAQVEFVLLKGFTQTPEYVYNPRHRTQSDLDLYVPEPMIERAQAALELIGYQPDQMQDFSQADHVPTMIRPGDWQWRGNPFDPDMPLSVELHFCLWNKDTSFFSLSDVDLFWERRTSRAVEDITFPAFSPVDHLAHLTLHILRNMLAGDWVIHHVHELATFLHAHAKDDVFWKLWKQTHSDSLRVIEAIAFFHARAWFSCAVHEEVETEIAGLPLGIKKWLQLFVGSALEGMFQQNKDFVWLHAALLPVPRERRKLLTRALLPRRVPRSDETVVRFRNRQARQFRSVDPYRQYVSYLTSRLAAHGRMIPTTLFRGLGWWFSQRQLGQQFWTFLAASFFLTWASRSTSFCSIFS